MYNNFVDPCSNTYLIKGAYSVSDIELAVESKINYVTKSG